VVASDALLGAAEIRAIAQSLDLRPTKTLGQNFVIDGNTVRRIARVSGVGPDDIVIEVGPGLGSLTLALLPLAKQVVAVEIDPVLARHLPVTVAAHVPDLADRLTIVEADALRLSVDDLSSEPTALVANLPYNVSVPVLLHLLETFPSINSALVMVQAEVADRLVADPGSRTYGIPSAKINWYGTVKRAGSVPPSVFWPEPRVDSGLVAFHRGPARVEPPTRREVFEVIDAAFSQRRKSLRGALSAWAGSPSASETTLRAAGVDPGTRGEQLNIDDFISIAAQAREPQSP